MSSRMKTILAVFGLVLLAQAGAMVVLASRDGDRCEAFADSLRGEGYAAAGMAVDLADEASILAFVGQVARDYGRIDILVDNAVLREGMAFHQRLQKRWSEGLKRAFGGLPRFSWEETPNAK